MLFLIKRSDKLVEEDLNSLIEQLNPKKSEIIEFDKYDSNIFEINNSSSKLIQNLRNSKLMFYFIKQKIFSLIIFIFLFRNSNIRVFDFFQIITLFEELRNEIFKTLFFIIFF